jgi:hypothetical protein
LARFPGGYTESAQFDTGSDGRNHDGGSRRNWRLQVYPAAVIAAVAGVVVLSALQGSGTSGEGKHLGADYPVFYAAGAIAADGAWDRLYDDEAQQAAQAGLVDDSGGFLYFAYPPPVAAACGLFSQIAYRWSYLLHTALMGLALWGAVRMARPFIPAVRRYPLAAFGVTLIS